MLSLLQRYGYFPNLTSTLTNIAKNTPMLENGCTKKLIPQFVCTYYLGLLPKVHFTILSIQIQDSPPVERNFFFGVPAPGLIKALIFFCINHGDERVFSI